MKATGRIRVSPAAEAGAWLALAAGMWLYSYRFDGEFPAYLWGPVSWPRAVLAAIVVLALTQLVLHMVLASRSGPSAEDDAGPRRDGGSEEGRHDPRPAGDRRPPARSFGDSTVRNRGRAGNGFETRDEWGEAPDERSEARSGADARLRIIATFTLPFLYLYLLPRTGYFATTPLFLVAYMLAFREHSLKYMLATAVLLYAGSLAIFSKLLFVPLPTGNWPGFYDFSNRLLVILDAI